MNVRLERHGCACSRVVRYTEMNRACVRRTESRSSPDCRLDDAGEMDQPESIVIVRRDWHAASAVCLCLLLLLCSLAQQNTKRPK